jgi:hypothetical protein
MAEIDREKQKRDEQISLFVRKTLTDLLRLVRPRKRRVKADLNESIVNITPEQQRQADEVMRIFREEDR